MKRIRVRYLRTGNYGYTRVFTTFEEACKILDAIRSLKNE